MKKIVLFVLFLSFVFAGYYTNKNGKKSVHNFDTGKTRPFMDNKKVNCSTSKSPQDIKGNKPPATRNFNTPWKKFLGVVEAIIRVTK